MKILYFYQHFSTPSIGGGGTRAYEFAKKLIDCGHSVTIVCGEAIPFNLPPSKIKNVYRGVVDGIDVIQVKIPYANNFGIVKRALAFVKFALKGIQIARSEKYSVLFATSTPLTAGIPGIFMKCFSRRDIKFVFEVRDLWPELPKALGMKNPLFLGGMSVLESLSYHKADACIGLSPGIFEGIRRVAPDKRIEMIPNGCDLDIFKPGNRQDLQLEGVLPTDTVAVFTGAHGVANGLDAVLDVAATLKERGRHDIKLVFIGNGKMKPSLIERANEEDLTNCLFFDRIPKTELNRIVACADIGLMVLKNVPAFYYGTSPNKFFDYIASGLPVVNNYPGWLADLIDENECGIVVPPVDSKAFADALIYLADNPKDRDKMGQKARQLAELHFSRQDLGAKFVEFLEEVSN